MSDKLITRINKETSLAETIDLETGEIVARQETVTPSNPIHYTLDLGLHICTLLAAGQSLYKVCNLPGMPSLASVYKWRREHEDFGEHYQQAVQDRADYSADLAVDIAADALDDGKDMVPARRLYHEALKWRAQVHKPETYSPKTKISGDAEQPVRFVIDTGVRRSSDYNKDETILEATKVNPLGGASDGEEAKKEE